MTATLTVAGNPCGCAQPCDGKSCGLNALVRPRFFCGQLLTDQDLSELTAWVLDRRRLGRYRDGWGAVCGLDVAVDPSAVATVLVQPGYAVSSCGEDVVLATATSLDLTSCCPDLTSPCATPSGEPPTACVVDVGIAYREVGEDPVLALGTSGCPQAGECEDSRILESFELRCVSVVDGSEPDRPDWRHWSRSYENAVAILQRAVADGLPGNATGDGLRSWLSDRLRDQPLQHFALVADWVEQGNPPSAERFAELLFWIAQDRILSVLDGTCPPGCPGEIVPLARVWLAAEASSSGTQQWVIKTIDPVSPFRRDFGPVRWPAPFGQLNLGRVVWHRIEEARLALMDLGVPINDVVQWSPSTLDDLIAMIGSPPVVAADGSVWLRYLTPSAQDTHLTGMRVVGFQPPPGSDRKTTPAPGSS